MIQPFLKTVPLFRELDDDELAQVLMVSLVKRYAPGSVILTEGAPGGQLHIIHQGQVRISKVVPGVGEEALTILSPGDFFGEVEFFDGSPASAHAIAHSECEILAIPHREVEGLMQSRRSEEHTSELQSHSDLVCRLLLEKKKCRPRWAARRGRKGATLCSGLRSYACGPS